MKNRALRHLSRLVAVAGVSSFPKALTDGTVKLDIPEEDAAFKALLEKAAEEDARLSEEGQGLARERGWSLLRVGTAHERWPRLDAARLFDALPRVFRVLRREAWEAETAARGCDDEEVASLLFGFAQRRKALAAELESRAPIAGQLGA